MTNQDTIAKTAYDAYCDHTRWKSLVTGADLPQWSEVKPEIRKAWEKAAIAVLMRIHSNPPQFGLQDGPVRNIQCNRKEKPPEKPEPCAECNGNGKLDGDVTYGDGVMAIERDCMHCNGTGVQ